MRLNGFPADEIFWRLKRIDQSNPHLASRNVYQPRDFRLHGLSRGSDALEERSNLQVKGIEDDVLGNCNARCCWKQICYRTFRETGNELKGGKAP
jgi:hypothetical protein